MMKSIPLILLASLLVNLFAWIPGIAQTDEVITLSLSRDFGYSSGTGQIQGTFSMRVSGPNDLVRIVFLVDGQVIGEDTTAPFRLQFRTESFPIGKHTLNAIGYTSTGKELHSNDQIREFVSASEGWSAGLRMVLPVLGLILLVMLLSFALPLLLERGKKGSVPLGKPRSYGLLGGTICKHCGRPFALHAYGVNVFIGKLDRCPHCGKWSIVYRVGLDQLRQAEAAELESTEGTPQVPGLSDEEKMRKDLDESRYQNL